MKRCLMVESRKTKQILFIFLYLITPINRKTFLNNFFMRTNETHATLLEVHFSFAFD